MPRDDQPPLTDRERRAATRRGATFDPSADDWLYAGRTIPAWLAVMTTDGRLRPEAARVAGVMIGPEAYPHVRTLIAALDDVRRTYTFACVALGQIGPRASEAIALLVDRMRATPKHGDDSPARATEDVGRSFAAEAIVKIGANASSIPALVEALGDSYPVVGRRAAAALGGLGRAAEPAVPALVEALDDPQLRLDVARALGRIGPVARSAGPALVALAARNEWHELTAAVVEALGRMGYAEGRDAIRPLLDHAYADVRNAAVKALERLGT